MLRKEMHGEELLLWNCIRDNQIKNYKFKRQHPFGYYILDFYCPEKKFAVELIGYRHHNFKKHHNDFLRNRENYFMENGVTVLKVKKSDIKDNVRAVLNQIETVLDELPSVETSRVYV